MAYIGRPLQVANLAVQSGSGNGSDTTPITTLDYATTTNGIGVYLDGVRQLAGTDFNVTSQTTLTFTTAPANGVGVDVYFLGLELSLPTPADATVTTAKIASNAIDETKLKDALVADFTEVVVTASDSILIGDATDSGNTKRDTVQGILDLASHTGNVAFPATQSASADANTLDDYEEGTWTPAFAFGGTFNGSYDTQVGTYTKVGRSVTASCWIDLSAKGSTTGTASVTGLPFTSLNVSSAMSSAVIGYTLSIVFDGTLMQTLQPNASTLLVQHGSDAGALGTISNTGFANTSRLAMSITYFTA